MKSSHLFFLAGCLGSLIAASPAESACRNPDVARGFIARAYAAEADAKIEYFGHNFFQITTRTGTKIVTDPLAPGMHPTPSLAPHAATVGREHPNHNHVRILGGNPMILRGLSQGGTRWNRVSVNVRDVFIYNVPIYQNEVGGVIEGAAFVFDLGNLCIAHLGDLSHTLTADQMRQMGRVDIALIPIGGVFTMTARIAREVLQQLKPKIAIPMHYRDNLYLLEPFMRGLPARKTQGDTLMISQSGLPSATEVVVLRPKGGTAYW